MRPLTASNPSAVIAFVYALALGVLLVVPSSDGPPDRGRTALDDYEASWRLHTADRSRFLQRCMAEVRREADGIDRLRWAALLATTPERVPGTICTRLLDAVADGSLFRIYRAQGDDPSHEAMGRALVPLFVRGMKAP